MEKLAKLLNRSVSSLPILLAFLFPLFFLPLNSDFFELNKNVLLVFVTLLATLLWALKMVFEKNVTFKRSAFDLPVILVALAFILSNVFVSNNKLMAFFVPGSTGTICALVLLYFVITNNLKTNYIPKIINALILSASLVSLVAAYQAIGIGEALAPVAWLKSKTFNPTGGPFALITFVLPALVLAIPLFLKELKEKRKPYLIFYIFSLVLMIAGIGTSAYQIISSKPVQLPYASSWAIALETMKQSPFLGVGPENFVSAFTKFKPITINNTDFWTLRFGVASNWYFQLVTVTGLAGLVAFLFLIYKAISYGLKTVKTNSDLYKKSLLLSLGLIFLIWLILPSNITLLFAFFLLLGLLGIESSEKQYQENSRILPITLLVPVIAVVAVGLYLFGKDWTGDFYFYKSLEAYAKNDGTNTYNLQIKAITLTPYQTNFRISYSQTNLALANALAAKTDLNDTDRQNISQLVQQSIREAKAAVALEPQSAIAWENLSSIYRNLINFAQGAENWTVASYQQAIAFDPYNPNLRIALGGVYYSLKNFEESQKQFEFATQLKPNLANAHYNLAAALKEQNKIDQAVAEMEAVLSLVPKDSEDYKKAETELAALKTKQTVKQANTIPSDTLNVPTPPTRKITPQVVVPSGAAPVSPTLAPQP